jgi:hypothetical protein
MTGRAPSGRATHERSQSPLSPPTAGVPNAAHGLSGAAYDTLHCLFVHGPTFDGDVPSKCGRDELVKRRLAMRHDGYQTLTIGGLRLALKLGMDRKKEKQGRELRELLANATQNRNIAEQARLLSKSHARAESLLQRVVDTTHCHIDGRDLLAEIHPRRDRRRDPGDPADTTVRTSAAIPSGCGLSASSPSSPTRSTGSTSNWRSFKVQIDEVLPEGYYKVRQRAKGPWIPIHIWLEDGERDPETWELLSDQNWKAEWAPRTDSPGCSRPIRSSSSTAPSQFQRTSSNGC